MITVAPTIVNITQRGRYSLFPRSDARNPYQGKTPVFSRFSQIIYLARRQFISGANFVGPVACACCNSANCETWEIYRLTLLTKRVPFFYCSCGVPTGHLQIEIGFGRWAGSVNFYK